MNKLLTVKQKTSIFAVLLMLVFTLTSAGLVFANTYQEYTPVKTPGDSQFDFDGNYQPPELTVDGLDTETQWSETFLTEFGVNKNSSKVKIYRGSSALFLYIEVADTTLYTYGETNDDKVTSSDSIEVYLDTQADGGIKPQPDDYQINLGIHGKTRIMQGSGSGWGNWNGLIDYEMKLNGSLNSDDATSDVGYSVELMIPYSQVGIEKNDIIGISFGQVNKVNATGNAVGTDWDWYGWTYENTLREPQSPNNYVILTADNRLMDRADIDMPNAGLAGYVKDSITKAPISGVNANVVGVDSLSAITDAQGYYVFANQRSDIAYTVNFTKAGYYSSQAIYTIEELRNIKGGDVVKQVSLTAMTQEKTTVSGVVTNVIKGAVKNATILVEGTTISATSANDGSFTLVDVPMLKDAKIIISAENYADTYTVLKKTDANIGGETTMGAIDINLPYASGMSFGGNNNTNMFQANITRNKTGMLYKLVTDTKFDVDERAELFIHAGAMTKKPLGIFVFGDESLGKDGRTDLFTQFDIATCGVNVDIEKHANNEGSTLYVSIPYALLDMNSGDVFAFSFGSFSGGKWDGFGHDGFVPPENAAGYLRVDFNNRVYKASDNIQQVKINGVTTIGGVTVTAGSKTINSDNDGKYALTLGKPDISIDVVFSKIGYVTQTITVTKENFGNGAEYTIPNVAMEVKVVSITGVVKDSAQNLLSGVSVQVNESAELVGVTNSNGEFSIANVGTATDAKITFTKTGYSDALHTISLADLNSNAVTFEANATLVESTKTMTINGAVKNVLGNVDGAVVTIEGTKLSATTAADGSFTIPDAPLNSCNLLVTKNGYETLVVAVNADGVIAGGTKAIGDVDLKLSYAVLGEFAMKNDSFGKFTGYVTRGIGGFEFKFVSKNAFTGRIELFIDTKISNERDARNSSDYLFNLNANGAITIVNWAGGGNETKPADMTLEVSNIGAVYTVVFILPYSFFGSGDKAVAPTEVIGISMGQFQGEDWDGWVSKIGGSYNDDFFVVPEMTKDYIRLDRNNKLYASEGNFEYAVTPVEYNLSFGTNLEKTAPMADDFCAKISRDATGLNFDFLARGSFRANNADECVMIYLDLLGSASGTGGWIAGAEDMIIKIYANGKAWYKIGSDVWWRGTTGATALGDIAMTRENGATTFSIAIPFTAMNTQADATIGFCIREAKERANEDVLLYDPWFDFFVAGHTANIDAAGQTSYPRIDASGAISFISKEGK